MLHFMPQRFENAIPQTSNATCYVYCRNTSEQAVNVGYGYIVKCSACELKRVISNCSNVDGVSVSIKASEEEFWQIVALCDITNPVVEEFASLVTVCGYSRKLTGGTRIDGRLVNVQLAYSDGVAYVGSPLILGSF